MTKKDYELIALALFEAKWSFAGSADEMRLDIISRLADVMVKDNPLFKVKKFKDVAI